MPLLIRRFRVQVPGGVLQEPQYWQRSCPVLGFRREENTGGSHASSNALVARINSLLATRHHPRDPSCVRIGQGPEGDGRWVSSPSRLHDDSWPVIARSSPCLRNRGNSRPRCRHLPESSEPPPHRWGAIANRADDPTRWRPCRYGHGQGFGRAVRPPEPRDRVRDIPIDKKPCRRGEQLELGSEPVREAGMPRNARPQLNPADQAGARRLDRSRSGIGIWSLNRAASGPTTAVTST